jgi:hypothetical protein
MFHEPGRRFVGHVADTAPGTRVTELPPGATLTVDPVR